MMQQQYVSFETAKLLKEKGFYQDYYSYPVYWMNGKNPVLSFEGDNDFPYEQNEVCAPSQAVAKRWLREIHNLFIDVYYDADIKGYMYHIDKLPKGATLNVSDLADETYEEACEAAIKYCLENLID